MRIWVTGIGVVSPLARGAGPTFDALLAGERGIRPLTLFDLPGSRARIAGEVPGIAPAEVAPPGAAEGWSRTDALAVLATREALGQAGLDPRRSAVDLIVGGTTAGMFETEDLLAQLSRDPDAIAPMAQLLSHPLSSTADHVHAAAGPFRRVRSVCSACSSGANAILLAASWLEMGRSRCVVAGGADGLCRLTYTGFGALAALDPEPCRPFDRTRVGLNLGEAAAFLVLEPAEDARARGALPIAELRGWAVGAEAHHITNPEREGRTAARVMSEALARGRITPADVDYVNAHGTATPLNDAMESAALRACFGAEVERVPVSSSKGQIGHTLGAAGAIEAAITSMAVARGVLPPTVGLGEVDPDCRLRHVFSAERADIRAAISNSFGFGGTDSVLLFTQPERFPELTPPRPRAVVVTGGATAGPLGLETSAASAAYLEPGLAPAPGALSLNPAEHLDVGRARRLDRAARLTTVVTSAALREAGLDGLDEAQALRAGAIFGAAFGSVDASTAFMRRVYDRGVKFASPADFPNLVPSSPVGHTSIYLGLRGPVFAVADLGATAESAIVTALELVSAGQGDALVAGSVEEASAMIERSLGPTCSQIVHAGVRSEGASALVLEAEATAAARGARPLARVVGFVSFRGEGLGALAELAAPVAGARVFVGRDDERLLGPLRGTPWLEVRRQEVAPRSGSHEGAGGFAAVAAVALVASGGCPQVLLLGGAPDRGYALVLEPAHPTGA